MAKNLQSKALRALGLTAASSLPPKDIVKASTAHNSLLFSDYVVFWREALEKVQTANKFFCEVVAKIIEIEKQEKKPKVVLKFEVDRVIYSLIHTIQYIDLFCPVDGSAGVIEKTFRNWESFKLANKGVKPSARFTTFERVMKNFEKRHLRSKNKKDYHSSDSSVLECAFVDPMDQTLIIHGLRDRRFSVLDDFPFMFQHLKMNVQCGGEGCFHYFNAVLKLLTALQSHARAKPIVAGSTLGNVLALLLLFREFLINLPVADGDLLRKALDVLSIFRSWPSIYAQVARELEVMVLKEIISPGNALRLRMMEENPILTSFGEQLAQTCSRNEILNWSMSQRKVYVYYNENLARGVMLRQLCSQDVPRGSLYEHQMHRCRMQLLITMLEAGLSPAKSSSGTASHWPHDFVSKLRISSRKPSEIERLFAKARDAVYETTTSSGGEKLLEVLKHLNQEVVADAGSVHKRKADPELYVLGTGTRRPSVNVASPQATGNMSNSNTSESATGASPINNTGGVTAPLPGGWGHHVYEIPELGMTFRGVSIAAMHQDRPGVVTMNGPPGVADQRLFLVRDRHKCPERYPKYANDFDNLVRDVKYAISPGPKQQYPKPQVGAGCDAPIKAKPKVKLLSLGGHEVLHRVVCNVVALQAMRPDLYALVDIQCYIIPVGSNSLASFIAQRDGWYRRQVFAAFYGPLTMSPQLRIEEDPSVPGDTVTRVLQQSFLAATEYAESRRLAKVEKSKKDLVSKATNPEVVRSIPSSPEPMPSPKAGERDQRKTQSTSSENMRAPENLPAALLQPLLQDYVRAARQRLDVRIYNCECWGDPNVVDFPNTPPDTTIPFCTRAELGLSACMATYVRMGLTRRKHAENHVGRGGRGNQGNTGFESAHGTTAIGEQIADPSWDELVQDKDFVKSWFEATPEVRVSMLPMDINGEIHEDPMDRIELRDGCYFSISICNMPAYTTPTKESSNRVTVIGHEPDGSAANPTYPSLEVNSVTMKGSCAALLGRKDKKVRDVEALKEAMREEAEREHVGVVDICSTTTSRRPFLICLDGQVFGPFYRIRISAAKSKYTNQMLLPVMTYFPLDM